jgi:hypothetical protein
LHAGAVTSLAFHARRPLLLTHSEQDGTAFVLDVRSEGNFRVLAISPKDSNLVQASWSDTKSLDLSLLSKSGVLSRAVSPNASVDIVGDPKPFAVDSQCTLAPAPSQTAVTGLQNEAYAIFPDQKELVQFSVASASGEGATVAAEAARYQGHQYSITCITCASASDGNGLIVVTGACNGSVSAWRVSGGGDGNASSATLIGSANHHAACIRTLQMSADGLSVVSTDANGNLFTMAFPSGVSALSVSDTMRETSLASTPGYAALADVVAEQGTAQRPKLNTDEGEEENHYLRSLQLRKMEIAKASHELVKSEMRKKIAVFREKLRQLLATNERVPDLEKMDRSEFVIDIEGRDALTAQGDERAQQVKNVIEEENIGIDLVSERIKQECWESMETQAQDLVAFQRDTCVANMPIIKQDKQYKRQLAVVVMQRRVELREVRHYLQDHPNAGGSEGEETMISDVWPGTLDEMPEQIRWLVNEGMLSASTDVTRKVNDKSDSDKSGKKKGSSDKKKDKGEGEGEGDEDAGLGDDDDEVGEGEDGKAQQEESMFELLYRPIGLKSAV